MIREREGERCFFATEEVWPASTHSANVVYVPLPGLSHELTLSVSRSFSMLLHVVHSWPPRQGPWVIHMATTAGPYIKREARLLLCFRIIPQEGFELKSAL